MLSALTEATACVCAMPPVRAGVSPPAAAAPNPSPGGGRRVEEGVAETRGKLHRYEEVTAQLGEADGDEMQRLHDELGSLQESLDHAGAWDLGSRLEQADGRTALPPSDIPVRGLSGTSGAGSRFAGYCCPSRSCSCWTSPPTISPFPSAHPPRPVRGLEAYPANRLQVAAHADRARYPSGTPLNGPDEPTPPQVRK